jgi:Kef-type K+ transport system membrane component KefB
MQDVLALVGFVAAVYLVGQAAELLRCPGLLGELLAGVILGPHGLQLLSAEMAGSLKTAGELGLLLMVMDGGLAMELPVLRKQGGRATVLALTGTVLPVLLGWATMVALGTGGLAAVAAGTALSSTAIGFTLRMMSELQLLETAQGQLITAAAMLDDVFSLVLLAMLRALQPAEDGQLRVEAWPLIRPLVGSLGVLVAAIACAALTHRIDRMLRSPPQRASPGASPPDAPPDTLPPGMHAPPIHGGGQWRWREALLAPGATVAAMVALGVL